METKTDSHVGINGVDCSELGGALTPSQLLTIARI